MSLSEKLQSCHTRGFLAIPKDDRHHFNVFSGRSITASPQNPFFLPLLLRDRQLVTLHISVVEVLQLTSTGKHPVDERRCFELPGEAWKGYSWFGASTTEPACREV